MPWQEDDGELEHDVVAPWEAIKTVEEDFARPKRGQLFLVVLRTTVSSRQPRKALQRHGVRACGLDKLAIYSPRKYGSDNAHRLRFGMDAQNAVDVFDTDVAQDDEAFECSDVHLASCSHAADWQSFLSTLLETALDQGKRHSALVGLSR